MPPIPIPLASYSISNVISKSGSARVGVVVNYVINSSNVFCCVSLHLEGTLFSVNPLMGATTILKSFTDNFDLFHTLWRHPVAYNFDLFFIYFHSLVCYNKFKKQYLVGAKGALLKVSI
jgi:hypothetical protein